MVGLPSLDATECDLHLFYLHKELGIGWRNQMIKVPLMRLAANEPHAFYAAFNRGEMYIPQEIADKSVGIDGDIAVALAQLAGSGM